MTSPTRIAAAAALLLFGISTAFAAEIPDKWRCGEGKENAFWKNAPEVSQKKGPVWGVKLDARVPAPFIWLVIYKNRDRDIAERRAPIEQRWRSFRPDEKCAYVKRYLPEAVEREREYIDLILWRRDKKLKKLIKKMDGEDVVRAQKSSRLKRWRKRFERMLGWIELQGLRDEGRERERALGIFPKIKRLNDAYMDFKVTTGHHEALVRIRFAERMRDLAAWKKALKAEQWASKRSLAFLDDEAARERVIGDISDYLSKDPENERVLGRDFDKLVVRTLRLLKRDEVHEAAKTRVEDIRRADRARKAAVRKIESRLEKLQGELMREEWSFGGDADPEILVGLQEYRKGKTAIAVRYGAAGEVPEEAELKKAYLRLLLDVCVTHYTSLRYKKKLVRILCGGLAPVSED